MKSALTVLTMLACLTSCAPAHFNSLACPPVPAYTPEQQHAAADELQACSTYAPAGFCRALFAMMGDYHVMRTQSLACRKAYSPRG